VAGKVKEIFDNFKYFRIDKTVISENCTQMILANEFDLNCKSVSKDVVMIAKNKEFIKIYQTYLKNK